MDGGNKGTNTKESGLCDKMHKCVHGDQHVGKNEAHSCSRVARGQCSGRVMEVP